MHATLPNVHALPARKDTSQPLAELLEFNVQLLDQALAIIDAHIPVAASTFSAHAGPHLRHVIEHFEALLFNTSGRIDYDARQRDRSIEQDPEVARARLHALQDRLCGLPLDSSPSRLEVQFCGGLDGQHHFTAESTYQRELLFVSSHAVHHFALIRIHCTAQGIDLPQPLGKAPATIAFEAAASKRND